MNDKMDTFPADLNVVASKLSVLDQLPELIQRVTAVEEGMTAIEGRLEALEDEQSNLQGSVRALGTAGASLAAENAVTGKVSILEASIRQLTELLSMPSVPNCQLTS